MTPVPTYEKDPYLTRLDVEIIEVGDLEGRPYAVLDDTICYPEGGGQPTDHGWLGDVPVRDVQRVDEVIRHYLEAPLALIPPGSALLTLDWERRYDHMQQHTAQHLLSALALERFGWATRSFHLGPETSDIELDAPELSADDLAALEQAARAEIIAGRTVNCRRVSPDEYQKLEVRSRGLPPGHSGDVRLVEIAGIDLNTCGGTHLGSTAEIEVVKIIGTERLRGGTRIRWVAGQRSHLRFRAHEERNTELRSLFDSDDNGLVEAANLKLDQLGEARRQIRHLESQLAEAKVESLAGAEGVVVTAHFEDTDGGLLQQIARALIQQAPNKGLLLTAESEKGCFFVVAAGPESPVDAAEVGPRVAEILEGRGGGSGGIFQGKAGSLGRLEEAESILHTNGSNSGD